MRCEHGIAIERGMTFRWLDLGVTFGEIVAKRVEMKHAVMLLDANYLFSFILPAVLSLLASLSCQTPR